MELRNDLWIRTCPQCNKDVEHKSKAKCRDGERRNKTCAACNRSNTGKRNVSIDVCPICHESFNVAVASSSKSCQLTSHAKKHDLTPERLWMLKNEIVEPKRCGCGCGKTTAWRGWHSGYSEFVNGHNGNIYSAYDPEIARQIAKKRSESLQGQPSWAKGLTKETDERIKIRGEKTSIGLLAAFKEGRIVNTSKFTHDEIHDLLSMNSVIKLKEIVDYKNCTNDSLLVACTKCQTQSIMSLVNARSDRCRSCNPVGSAAQHELGNWIESVINEKIERNVKDVLQDRFELDLYIPSHKLAIELNGIYWHDERHRDHKYHQKKTDACKSLGIKLIHIYEDEWRDKKDIVKSILLTRMNKIESRLSAKECKIIELSINERQEFFESNHIDGDTAAARSWGLLHKEKIVAAVSIKKPFHKKHNDKIEIARFCSVINMTITGGFSRLFEEVITYAKNNEKSILTYVDERFGGNGNAYQIAGMKFIGKTSPKFWWTDGRSRFSRFTIKNDRKNGLSESIVAENAGVVKIWGCRHLIFEMKVCGYIL